MAKIICPECDSKNIIFGKDFLHYRFWIQDPEEPTFFYDYEIGKGEEEKVEQNIFCSCSDCNHKWDIEGSIDEYMDY